MKSDLLDLTFTDGSMQYSSSHDFEAMPLAVSFATIAGALFILFLRSLNPGGTIR